MPANNFLVMRTDSVLTRIPKPFGQIRYFISFTMVVAYSFVVLKPIHVRFFLFNSLQFSIFKLLKVFED